MSLLSLGIKMLFAGAKSAGKLTSEYAGVGKGVMKVSGPYSEKIAELSADKSVSPAYIQGLIAQGKKSADLDRITHYLESGRNTIPYNVTSKLLKQAIQKSKDAKWEEHLATVKERWLDHHDTLVSILDHAKEML